VAKFHHFARKNGIGYFRKSRTNLVLVLGQAIVWVVKFHLATTKKKGMRLVQNDFCEKNGPKLPYFEGENS
jgi:hypothetical protein